jgi:hypothetical protein
MRIASGLFCRLVSTNSFIGIDVAKAQVEFACRPSGETGTVSNEEVGIRAPVERIRDLARLSAPTGRACPMVHAHLALARRKRQADPPSQECDPAEGSDRAEPPDARERQDVEAPGEEEDPAHE